MTDGETLIANRYRLISQVGSGAMGVVWRARDERLGRTVAVKQLRTPVGMSSTQIEQSQLRARREARIAARLHHPHAVAVYDVVDHDGHPCLVMEYVPSSTLSAVLADGKVLPAAEVAEMGTQLASALRAAHEAGIVHRDVKPGNILIAEGGAVKLTDFGISRATGDVTVTATGEMLGTPAYTSPEVAQGRVAGVASDVFSLGATLYAALEGEPPFGMGPTAMALLLRIVNDEVRPPQHISALTGTVMWMLRHDPADRPSMEEVRRSLESATAETIAVAPLLPEESPESPESPESQEAADGQGGPGGPGGSSTAGAGKTAVDGGDMKRREPSDAVPAPKSEPSSAGPSSRRPWTRKRMLPWLLLAVAALLTAGIVAAITASGGSGGSSATPAKSTSPARASHSATSSASATAKASSSSVSSPSVSPSQTSASPTTSASSPTSTAQQLTSAIENYYKLVPGDLNTAWGYMTANYQQNTAGGMSGYQSFWSKIDHVSLADLVAQPPSTVVVTIDYFYKDGQEVQERTEFGLVKQSGIWKIASSSVLSSRTV